MPLWIPTEDLGFAQRSNQRYLDANGLERALEALLSDVLADERARGLRRTRRAGLSRSEEMQLLSELVTGA